MALVLPENEVFNYLNVSGPSYVVKQHQQWTFLRRVTAYAKYMHSINQTKLVQQWHLSRQKMKSPTTYMFWALDTSSSNIDNGHFTGGWPHNMSNTCTLSIKPNLLIMTLVLPKKLSLQLPTCFGPFILCQATSTMDLPPNMDRIWHIHALDQPNQTCQIMAPVPPENEDFFMFTVLGLHTSSSNFDNGPSTVGWPTMPNTCPWSTKPNLPIMAPVRPVPSENEVSKSIFFHFLFNVFSF